MRRVSEWAQWSKFQAGLKDAHGNPAEGWGTPAALPVYAFDPGGSSEPRIAGHDRVVTTPTVFVPFDYSPAARDRVEVRGLLFEVEGQTREWVHPRFPDRRGNVCELRRVDG